jgi:hypothetical protein
MKRSLGQIRQAVHDGHYDLTGHALEEMEDDELVTGDIEHIILTGSLRRRMTRDPRGPRYVVDGWARNGRKAEVVCRFVPSGRLRIITAYTV